MGQFWVVDTWVEGPGTFIVAGPFESIELARQSQRDLGDEDFHVAELILSGVGDSRQGRFEILPNGGEPEMRADGKWYVVDTWCGTAGPSVLAGPFETPDEASIAGWKLGNPEARAALFRRDAEGRGRFEIPTTRRRQAEDFN